MSKVIKLFLRLLLLCFISNSISAFLEDRAAHFEDLTAQWTVKFEKEVMQLDEAISETKDVMIALKLKVS